MYYLIWIMKQMFFETERTILCYTSTMSKCACVYVYVYVYIYIYI